MEPDPRAPVMSSAEARISAAPATVWETLSDLASWPEWMPGVKRVRFDSPPAVDGTFRWKAGRTTIRSRFTHVEPPSTLEWEGRAFGMRANHSWLLQPTEGGTVVHTEETMRGLLPRLFKGPMDKVVSSALVDGVAALRDEAERRTREAEAVGSPRADG